MSPLLSNIYLDQLDQYVAQTLIPAHTCGRRRRRNPAYKRISRQITTTLNPSVAKALRKQRRAIPSIDPFDPDYRRLHYLRYADDFVRHEARTGHGARAPTAGRRAVSLSP
jgi:hypothetical protein